MWEEKENSTLGDIKSVVAKNISMLRQSSGMTQIDLAEKLNYSDKSISKWERAESIPDISVLLEIASIFGVTLDYLVTEDHSENGTKDADKSKISKRQIRNRGFITGMSVLLVWLVAALAFVISDISITDGSVHAHYLAFAYAVPVSMIVWLVFNSIWFNRRRNFLIISLLMWSCLASLCVSFAVWSINIWLIMILGIIGQAIIILWSRMNTKD